jgi:Flp pilus assembly protein TadG
MAVLKYQPPRNLKHRAVESGQAIVEFTIVATIMLIFFLMLIDFGRAIYDLEVMSGLSRQGSNLASRGTDLSDAVSAVISGDAPLNLSQNGEVIITAVSNAQGVNTISAQQSLGGTSNTSQIGTYSPTRSVTARLPSSASEMIQANQTIYVTEIFYSFRPITPIGNILHVVMPSTLYQAAYF